MLNNQMVVVFDYRKPWPSSSWMIGDLPCSPIENGDFPWQKNCGKTAGTPNLPGVCRWNLAFLFNTFAPGSLRAGFRHHFQGTVEEKNVEILC